MCKKISLIVSVYNEQDGLRQFFTTTKGEMDKLTAARQDYSYELLFVNDGSVDKSSAVLSELKEAAPEIVRVISFSRNFGHEAAMTAGLDYAEGDFLIFMDADLQHPPACVPEIMDAFEAGHDIISMVRTKNEDSSRFGSFASATFYKIINSISDANMTPAASDFFALDKQAAEVLRHNYREKVRFLRGFVQNIGFDRINLSYEAGARAAGASHYNFKRLLKLSIDAMTCFSDMPLKLGIYAGLLSGCMGIVLIVYTLITRGGAPSGYATIVILLCFMFAVLFMLLGVMGSYISIIFREMKDRPIYIIEDIR